MVGNANWAEVMDRGISSFVSRLPMIRRFQRYGPRNTDEERDSEGETLQSSP